MRSRQRTAQVCGALKVAAVIKVVCEAGKANPRYTRTENNDTNDTERERERERERESTLLQKSCTPRYIHITV